MKGQKKPEPLTVDNILSLTNGGKDIFIRYVGKISSVMKCPWRVDKKPSWGIFYRDGVYFWKDQATEEVGNAFHLVQRLFDLDFKESLEKIKWDFNLGGKPIVTEAKTISEEKRDLVHINYKTQNFTKRHHDFWNCVEVTEDWCKKYNCFAVKELYIDRKRYYISEGERVFVYQGEKGCKIYFPDRIGMQRFRNNLPYNYLWNLNKIVDNQRMVIQKSMKDLITLAQIFPNIIATQAEHRRIFSPEVVNILESKSNDIWVWYGSDADGVKKCQKITGELGWKYINTPAEEDKSINDCYSFTCKYGLKKLEEFCKLKNLI